jgi:hypothetical protein
MKREEIGNGWSTFRGSKCGELGEMIAFCVLAEGCVIP